MPSVLERALCAAFILSLGCASRASAQPGAAAASKPAPVAAAVPDASRTPATVADATTAEPKLEEASPPPPLDPSAGAVPQSLPELKVHLSGLHIGGGPNDAATKRPFIEVLETGYEPMRACYSHVEEPGKGGTFGVDLRVERAGGHPTVKGIRTAMKGDQFRACVEQAFLALSFGRPSKPTVLSASVRFSMEP